MPMMMTVVDVDIEKYMARPACRYSNYAGMEVYFTLNQDGKTTIIGTGKVNGGRNEVELFILPSDEMWTKYFSREPHFVSLDLSKMSDKDANFFKEISFNKFTGNRALRYSNEDMEFEHWMKIGIVGKTDYDSGLCWNFFEIEPLNEEASIRQKDILEHRKTQRK